MQKNVGTIDAIMRITCGLAGLAWATSRMTRRYERRTLPMLVAMISAMRVAEGVTRYCPMLQLLGTNTLEQETTSKTGNKIPSMETAHPNR